MRSESRLIAWAADIRRRLASAGRGRWVRGPAGRFFLTLLSDLREVPLAAGGAALGAAVAANLGWILLLHHRVDLWGIGWRLFLFLLGVSVSGSRVSWGTLREQNRVLKRLRNEKGPA